MLLDGDVTDLVRWGILATGHIASVFARDLALLSNEARLLAVGSRSLDKAMAFAADHGIPRAYESYAELAGDPDVDVVYVASPHSDHFSSAKLCLEAGKSVLVEKPLTTSPADTEELINLASDRGLFLMEAMWTGLTRCSARRRRWQHPVILEISDMCRQISVSHFEAPRAIGCSTQRWPEVRFSMPASIRCMR